MPIIDLNYIEQQLYRACPVPPKEVQQIRIKIQTELGATNYLSITPEQFSAIESILLGVKK